MPSPKVHPLEDVQYKASVVFQILLFVNLYLSTSWTVIYGFHVFYNIMDLKDFHGSFVVGGYIVAVCMEFWRLYAGYCGNLRAKTGYLSIFLTLTVLIQMPLLLFLCLSNKIPVILVTLSTGSLLLFMILEIFIGSFTWRELSHQQIELYKLRRQTLLQQRARLIEEDN